MISPAVELRIPSSKIASGEKPVVLKDEPANAPPTNFAPAPFGVKPTERDTFAAKAVHLEHHEQSSTASIAEMRLTQQCTRRS